MNRSQSHADRASGETRDRGVILPLQKPYATSAISSADTTAKVKSAQAPVSEKLAFPSLRMIAGCLRGGLASFIAFTSRADGGFPIRPSCRSRSERDYGRTATASLVVKDNRVPLFSTTWYP